jgi:hypothetical protein
VIQRWLQGRPRNDIAAENGLSSGAVTNIVNEWRRNLGFAAADELRELAVTLKKVGITAAQCALGFRIAAVMLNVGVKEDSFESFILDVYNRCKDIGLSPENISFYLQDLIEFSRTILPLSKIPEYIKEKTDEKRKLQQEIENIKIQKETLLREKRDAESIRDTALQQQRMTISELKCYSQLKAELIKYRIPVDDISKFAKIVDSLREHGYDVGKVINIFSDFQLLRSNHGILQSGVQSLQNNINNLEQRRATLEASVKMHSQAISKYQHLKDMGFGLNELDYLLNTINEIAIENGIPLQQAVKKFLTDVEQQYNSKLGFESKLENMREEVNSLRKEQTNLRTDILLNPLIAPKLLKLTQSGASDHDIINIAAIFERYAAGIDRHSFISDLEKYAGIKSAIQRLTQEADRLRKDAAWLKTQREALDLDNQRILSSSMCSRQIVSLLEGAAFSLRNEIIGLASICAFITHLLKPQFNDVQKLQSDHLDEFAALSRSNKGEAIPIKELKKAVSKAIEVLSSKIDPNDTLTSDLFNAYAALTE